MDRQPGAAQNAALSCVRCGGLVAVLAAAARAATGRANGSRAEPSPPLARRVGGSWIGVQGPRSCSWCRARKPDAGFWGKAPNVDATGQAVAAHPTGARLGGVEGAGSRSFVVVPGAKAWPRIQSAQGWERSQEPGRVPRRGVHGGGRPPALVGCSGRAKRRPCQACCATTHRLSTTIFRHGQRIAHSPALPNAGFRVERPERKICESSHSVAQFRVPINSAAQRAARLSR